MAIKQKSTHKKKSLKIKINKNNDNNNNNNKNNNKTIYHISVMSDNIVYDFINK